MDNTLGKIPCFLRLSRKVIGCSSHESRWRKWRSYFIEEVKKVEPILKIVTRWKLPMHLEVQFFFKGQKDAVFMRRLIVCLCGPRHKGRMRLPVTILGSHPI